MYSNARVSVYNIFFIVIYARAQAYLTFFVCDVRAPKTDFEKSQALGKKYYGHPDIRTGLQIYLGWIYCMQYFLV